MTWSTTEDIAARVRRRWSSGSLLRAYAANEPFPRIEVPLRGPRVAEIGDRFTDVQRWISDLQTGARDGSRYRLEVVSVGGRLIGRNELPSRAILDSYDQAWSLLRVGGEVARFDEARAAASVEPVVDHWIAQHPLRAVSLAEDMSRVVAAFRWLEDHRGSGRYLREMAAPGVDTKFAEQHREVLGQLLGVPTTTGGFLTGLGLATKPAFIRMRPDPGLGLFAPVSEVALRGDELSQLEIDVNHALIVENEITYLSVPIRSGGVVLWGKGFDVDRAGSLPWLREADITYWGDIDTHGFAILNRLRAMLPQTRSILMDRSTLLSHRERWGAEPSPTSAPLRHLTADESSLYGDLVTDQLGSQLRLEQERIAWPWAQARLGSTGA